MLLKSSNSFPCGWPLLEPGLLTGSSLPLPIEALLPALVLPTLTARGAGAGVTYSCAGVVSLLRKLWGYGPEMLIVRRKDAGPRPPTCTIRAGDLWRSLLLPNAAGDVLRTILSNGARLGVSMPALPSLL